MWAPKVDFVGRPKPTPKLAPFVSRCLDVEFDNALRLYKSSCGRNSVGEAWAAFAVAPPPENQAAHLPEYVRSSSAAAALARRPSAYMDQDLKRMDAHCLEYLPRNVRSFRIPKLLHEPLRQQEACSPSSGEG